MITPKDIEEKTFAKAVFGGYVMDEVDDFIEVVSTDYENVCNENEKLKNQIQLLAAKVDEYHSKEESMRSALTNAQKKSEELVKETKTRCEQMLRQAEDQSRKIQEDTQLKINEKEAYLTELCNSTEKYIETLRLVMAKQDEQLKSLTETTAQVKPEAPVAPAPKAKEKQGKKKNKGEKKPMPTLQIPDIDMDDDGTDEATAQEINAVVSDAMNESKPEEAPKADKKGEKGNEKFNFQYMKFNK